MSEDEKPSGTMKTAPDIRLDGGEPGASASRAKHKVIADIHSGMVLVAPVATSLEEGVGDEQDPDSESPPDSGSN